MALIIDRQNNIDRSQIKAIGSHGQTIRHRPEHGFTLQIGDPNIITEITQLLWFLIFVVVIWRLVDRVRL